MSFDKTQFLIVNKKYEIYNAMQTGKENKNKLQDKVLKVKIKIERREIS